VDRTRDESIAWARMYLADFPENGLRDRATNRLWAADILRFTAPDSDSLDAAWAETEAAVRERGGAAINIQPPGGGSREYHVEAPGITGVPNVLSYGRGPILAAALRALSAKLREVGR
jgi:hypothetical protein